MMSGVINKNKVESDLTEKKSAEVVQFQAPEEVETIDGEEWEEAREIETVEERASRQSVYHTIKSKLVARGIPEQEIAFIHDADTPARKAQLIRYMNSGRVRVLLGSTSKMGVALNAQERLIALHHLDAPWRPSDVEQREGRILRQGNIYKEAHILQYVTRGSFDGYIWQILESKARFISQIMAGEVTVRTAEDVGDMVLTAAQVKAVASGNPKVMEHVRLGIELTKSDRLRAGFYNSRAAMRYDLTRLPGQIKAISDELIGHDRAIKARLPLNEGEFEIQLKKTLTDERYSTVKNRQDAGRMLRHLSELVIDIVRRAPGTTKITEEVGTYRGFKMYLHVSGNSRFSALSSLFDFHAEVHLRAEQHGNIYVATIGDSDVGITQSMDYQLRSIEDRALAAIPLKASLEKKYEDFQAEVINPWEHAGRYARLRRRYLALTEELQEDGVAVEDNVTFSELDEDEITAEDEREESELVAQATSLYELEARPHGSLTGLETDPIIVVEHPNSFIHELEGAALDETLSVVALSEESILNTHKNELAELPVPEDTGAPPATVWRGLLSIKSNGRERTKGRIPNPNQMGFAWMIDSSTTATVSPGAVIQTTPANRALVEA
jgi:hypothetical protein